MTNSKFRCPGCKNYFPIADAYSGNGVNRYCSADCANGRSLNRQPMSVNSSFKRTPASKSRTSSDPPAATVSLVMTRDAGRCRRCGTTRSLHRHHICYKSEGIDHQPHNLIVLCGECHGVVHSNKRYWKPILLAYIWIRYVDKRLLTIGEIEKLVSR